MQGKPRKVEAALLLPPFYYANTMEAGLKRWLRMVLEAARQPVYLQYPMPMQHAMAVDRFPWTAGRAAQGGGSAAAAPVLLRECNGGGA